jgi:stress-induced morphogen
VVSEKFEGKRLLERHRMGNTALAEHMSQIHAVSIKKALTPAQAQPQPQPQPAPADDKPQA